MIGINSQIYSRTGGYMGVSFAIPIDIANDVANELRTSGKVTRGRVGVQVQELSVDLANSFGLQEPKGALVAAVEQGGPADKAGITPGDVIRSVNGQQIENSADLARMVAKTKPGTTVTLDVWRKGNSVPVKVTVGEMTQQAAVGSSESSGQSTAQSAGLSVGELPDEQRRSLKIDSGVLVQSADGQAARAGIRPGDIILRMNDNPVKSVAAFESQLSKNRGKTVALLIKRGPGTLFLPLEVPAGK